ncbi:restriction endonuclease subunit S [Streptococcus suis]|nr:restriction endonuclease subunit S [Streptococcus suis]HEM4288593.1 restriction endonuclease subunit S [Streptococcus suis]
MNDWKKVKLGEIIEFNPTERLSKGTLAKKIAMEKIEPFTRDIPEFELLEYKGGTKFRNGDTLMARITPSLENGKTAKVSLLDEEEVGFGSTEFIVARARNGISDENFIYYLMLSPSVRDVAIKSMVGTSGRQRVQLDVVKNHEVLCPPLSEQIQIGKILSVIDDKIENNKKINHHLEQMAMAIFKSWFVDFEPFGREMPKNWKEYSLLDVVNINYGKNLPTKNLLSEGYRVFGGNGQIGYFSDFHHKKERVLISCRGAASGTVHTSRPFSFITNNSLVVNEQADFHFAYLKQWCLNRQFFDVITGSAQPQITIDSLKSISIIMPEANILKLFSKILSPLYLQLETNKREMEILIDFRDTLLPKLLSGEICVNQATK